MTTIRSIAAGLSLAAAVPLAAAQTVTLGFDDLSPAGGFFGVGGAPVTYKGFNFGNATGTGSSWFWAAETPVFPSFPAAGNNITPTASGAGLYDASVISNTTPFKLVSAVFTGPGGPIGIELVDTSNNSYFLGPHFNAPSDLGTGNAGTFFGGTLLLQSPPSIGTGSSFVYLFTNTEHPSLWLKEVVFWGEGYTYAVDNIVVDVVPEPSAYAMALVGLAGMALLARRRRQ